MTVLMVAEKPSIASTLANVFSEGKHRTERGVASSSPVHVYDGEFQGARAVFKVTSVIGHVYNTDFTEDYQVQSSLLICVFSCLIPF